MTERNVPRPRPAWPENNPEVARRVDPPPSTNPQRTRLAPPIGKLAVERAVDASRTDEGTIYDRRGERTIYDRRAEPHERER